jgi:hypothetical protein
MWSVSGRSLPGDRVRRVRLSAGNFAAVSRACAPRPAPTLQVPNTHLTRRVDDLEGE